ncbi:MAG TPA: penicillin-binding transpeptidase domain-containing protein [Vicinamibacterales bacterium]
MIERIRRAWARHGNRRITGRAAPPDGRAMVKRRIAFTAIAIGLWATAIEARLVYLQVIDRGDLVDRAERQQMRTRPLPAKRGDILDRRGRVLATSVDADSIYAIPSALGDPQEAVAKLCGALGDCTAKDRQELADRLKRQRNFAYVRRQVSPDEAKRVAALNLDGVGFVPESRRFYPNRELAAHLLGFVGIDNKGLGGLESAYDSQIRGKEGQVLVHTDARRHAFSRFERPPTSGSTIELTIDEYLQHVAERELRAGVAEHRADGGSAIVIDPHTGEILAMANEPTFNPNVYRDFAETTRRNRAVQDLYEPGSTFKIVTASAAIEEKVLPIDALIDTSPGIIRIGNRVVDEYQHHNYQTLSFTDVIVKSSNVGAIKIGFRVGTERLSRYVDRYGFGRPVSPDFPGENPGIVWSADKWTDSALASVSMGYQIGVTPLQMIAAFGSVANGGEYVEPRIVRAAYRDGRRYAVHPKVLRRTIEPNTAATLISIMEEVVKRGTAKLADIPGYTVAGKTGTASKLISGHYAASENNVSFAGFVPSRNPAIAIIVVLDAPHAGGSSGGVVSAPIFKRIAESALRYLGVPPTINPAPPVLVARRDDSGPQPTAAVEPPVVNLVADGPGTLPDLRGMSAREATRTLVKLGLTARLAGDGFVVAQDPQPGSPIDEGGVCRLTLARAPARVLVSAGR